MKKYRVIGERILVQRFPAMEDDGGLLIPEKVKKRPYKGTVLAVGDEVTKISVGEVVNFSEYAGNFLEKSDFEESDLIVMRQDEVLAVEDEEEGETEGA